MEIGVLVRQARQLHITYKINFKKANNAIFNEKKQIVSCRSKRLCIFCTS